MLYTRTKLISLSFLIVGLRNQIVVNNKGLVYKANKGWLGTPMYDDLNQNGFIDFLNRVHKHDESRAKLSTYITFNQKWTAYKYRKKQVKRVCVLDTDGELKKLDVVFTSLSSHVNDEGDFNNFDTAMYKHWQQTKPEDNEELEIVRNAVECLTGADRELMQRWMNGETYRVLKHDYAGVQNKVKRIVEGMRVKILTNV